jgi:hypothetical protein
MEEFEVAAGGNIDLSDPIKFRSTFMVCHANDTADRMGSRLDRIARPSSAIAKNP